MEKIKLTRDYLKSLITEVINEQKQNVNALMNKIKFELMGPDTGWSKQRITKALQELSKVGLIKSVEGHVRGSSDEDSASSSVHLTFTMDNGDKLVWYETSSDLPKDWEIDYDVIRNGKKTDVRNYMSGDPKIEKDLVLCYKKYLEKNPIKPVKETFEKKHFSNVEFDGIDHSDYPDYVDAYITSADYKGKPLTDKQLEDLADDSSLVYELLQDYLH